MLSVIRCCFIFNCRSLCVHSSDMSTSIKISIYNPNRNFFHAHKDRIRQNWVCWISSVLLRQSGRYGLQMEASTHNLTGELQFFTQMPVSLLASVQHLDLKNLLKISQCSSSPVEMGLLSDTH